jgi:O-antigen ligase
VNSFEVLWLLALAILAHVGLILASRKINALFLLAGAFIVLSLLSVALALSMYTAAKYARVYTTVLMVAYGVGYYRIHAFDLAVRMFGVFMVYSLLSPLWSVVPLTGIAYKSFFVLSFFSGVFLAYSIRDWREAQVGLRWLVVLSALGTFYAILFLVPDQRVLANSRLMFFDINPGRIGGTAASMALLCCYVGLYDESRTWRWLGVGTMVLLLALIALTGNRSGFLVAVVGSGITALPLLQRPRRLIPVAIVLLLLAVGAFLALHDTYGMQRVFSLTNTRETQWRTNVEIISRSLLFGHGWIFSGRDAGYANLHSMYFQILAEMGIVGILLFTACLMPFFMQWYHCYRSLGRIPRGCEFSILPLTFVAAALVMGLFETAALAGTLPDTLFWGFGVGLVDRLPALLRQESLKTKVRLRYRCRPPAGMV